MSVFGIRTNHSESWIFRFPCFCPSGEEPLPLTPGMQTLGFSLLHAVRLEFAQPGIFSTHSRSSGFRTAGPIKIRLVLQPVKLGKASR